jgi:hypothetical protein
VCGVRAAGSGFAKPAAHNVATKRRLLGVAVNEVTVVEAQFLCLSGAVTEAPVCRVDQLVSHELKGVLGSTLPLYLVVVRAILDTATEQVVAASSSQLGFVGVLVEFDRDTAEVEFVNNQPRIELCRDLVAGDFAEKMQMQVLAAPLQTSNDSWFDPH